MEKPLASRMRPGNINEVVGQQHLLAEGKIINRMIKAGRISPMILYGPPGTGKTSIARAISGTTGFPFYAINAVDSGKKDMETVVKKARQQGRSMLFVDEIHRFNKAQQDYLLPYIESGLIILIGATTENPYHDVNPTIRSRCQIYELKSLSAEEIKKGLNRALTDKTNGLGLYDVNIAEDVFDFISFAAGGDMRSSLNALELAVLSAVPEAGKISVDMQAAEECMYKKAVGFDKNGDNYYDMLSAFHKSIRGSDVHAAIHYLGQILEGGDLTPVLRRLMVIAYEDIGLANPGVGSRVVSACQAAERLGLPEARTPLAVAVIELCLSPKSNSAYEALNKVIEDIRSGATGEVPMHLKDSHYKGAARLGRGNDYKYPHDYTNNWVNQQYLPDRIKDRKYYEPQNNGREKVFAEIFFNLEQKKKNSREV
ncbi:MAG: replication-associated recombination protein A [Clostridiales bacterium]|nr:replication-associated recombination protein A [Clostridiales bacterium]MCF8022763.1 replication-associated recombination protein A [Clostridiales bacterium]